MFVYRDEYYNPEDTDSAGIAELLLAKHRNGPTGMEKVAFQKRYAKFTDLAAVAA
jgi:Replicative DNA helicase